MTKEINHNGKTYTVPNWVKYVTQDNDSCGAIIAWETEPMFVNSCWKCAKDWLNPGDSILLGHAETELKISLV